METAKLSLKGCNQKGKGVGLDVRLSSKRGNKTLPAEETTILNYLKRNFK
ncbi:MAG: hypothetical protein F6K48_25090 [Okeania sp. SIO3H1]|nr:hypothetical protein [Okeania sp. SIO1I7]NEN92002.1 hypothetical protein [Okeania sp. SIO3H1]NET28663.1 hypothetical protein [Okeania sp. SIO1I7]